MNNNLSGFKIVDGRLVGHYALSANEQILVVLDIDESDPVIDDFSDLLSAAAGSLNALTAETLGHLKTSIAVELTDAAYPDADASTKAKDSANLKEELALKEIVFYLDDEISMIFQARNEYPDMSIYCQVDQLFAIEDLAVHPD